MMRRHELVSESIRKIRHMCTALKGLQCSEYCKGEHVNGVKIRLMRIYLKKMLKRRDCFLPPELARTVDDGQQITNINKSH